MLYRIILVVSLTFAQKWIIHQREAEGDSQQVKEVVVSSDDNEHLKKHLMQQSSMPIMTILEDVALCISYSMQCMWKLNIICDRLWDNPPCGIFCKNHKSRCFNYWKYYIRTSLDTSLGSIACSISEIWNLLCDNVWTIELEKLQYKGVVVHAHGISVYYECIYIGCGRGLTVNCRSNEMSERVETKTARLW